jgi:hypothetical protein
LAIIGIRIEGKEVINIAYRHQQPPPGRDSGRERTRYKSTKEVRTIVRGNTPLSLLSSVLSAGLTDEDPRIILLA